MNIDWNRFRTSEKTRASKQAVCLGGPNHRKRPRIVENKKQSRRFKLQRRTDTEEKHRKFTKSPSNLGTEDEKEERKR